MDTFAQRRRRGLSLAILLLSVVPVVLLVAAVPAPAAHCASEVAASAGNACGNVVAVSTGGNADSHAAAVGGADAQCFGLTCVLVVAGGYASSENTLGSAVVGGDGADARTCVACVSAGSTAGCHGAACAAAGPTGGAFCEALKRFP